MVNILAHCDRTTAIIFLSKEYLLLIIILITGLLTHTEKETNLLGGRDAAKHI
jgi:hypothetical protein